MLGIVLAWKSLVVTLDATRHRPLLRRDKNKQ